LEVADGTPESSVPSSSTGTAARYCCDAAARSANDSDCWHHHNFDVACSRSAGTSTAASFVRDYDVAYDPAVNDGTERNDHDVASFYDTACINTAT